MFCVKCGQEMEDSEYCPNCGIELVTEEVKKVGDKGIYIDEEGFIRKPRDEVSGIFSWIVGGIIFARANHLPSEYDSYYIILLLFGAIPLYYAINKFSSHDFETWKHSTHVKLWMFVGCMFGIGGIIVYYYLKRKERKYFATLHNQSLNRS